MSKKYLIIEDEPISAMYLKSMILKLKSNVEVCGPVVVLLVLLTC